MQIAPGLERRLRLVETVADAAARKAVEAAAEERLIAALAEVPRPVLQRMVTLADAADDEAAATLEADTELVIWLERLMGHAG